MGFKTILVPIEQHDLANSTLADLSFSRGNLNIEGAPARSCIALSLSIRSQPVARTRIARQSDQGFPMPSHKFHIGETVMVKRAFSRNVPGG
jgi:hypothetical protein